MSREVKIGLLAFITIFLAIWGYKFIKGQDLFQKSSTYYTTFSDVTGLAVSSDVTLNGYKIGTVTSIKLNTQNVKQMDVFFRIDGKVSVPKNAEVVLKSEGIVGGKLLALEFDKPCTEDCASDGAYLKNRSLGLLGSLVDPKEINSYVDNAGNTVKNVLADLGKDGSNAKVDLIVKHLEQTLLNMSKLTNNLNSLVSQSNNNMASTLSNINKVTKNLADNNAQVASILSNFNTTSKSFASFDMKGTNTMIENSNEMVKKLDLTMTSANATVKSLDNLLHKLNSGGGSLGQLINDKNLYNNLESTSKNLSLLLQDMRLNPKRYVNVSLIGRKDKPYTLPENDPANMQPKEK